MSFEKLRVYRAAVLLDTIVLALINGALKGHAKDLNQLKAACGAILANIAEAFGSEHIGQKIYHLGIARGSSDEVRSHLRRLVRDGVFTEAQIKRAVPLTVVIAKMLTEWIETLGEGEDR